MYREIYIKNQQNQPIISFTIREPEGSRIAGYRGIVAGYKIELQRDSLTAQGLLIFMFLWLYCFPLLYTIKLIGLDQISPNLSESLQHWVEKTEDYAVLRIFQPIPFTSLFHYLTMPLSALQCEALEAVSSFRHTAQDRTLWDYMLRTACHISP